MYVGYYDSKVGLIQMCADDTSLLSCLFVDKKELKEDKNEIINRAINQIDEYFKGNRFAFDLPLKLVGTDFQIKVWKELMKIPYGETCSYFDIAYRINMPKACRAVGNANNKNKFVILIPCHRVIGKNNKMVGYAGGINKKEALLTLEALNC